MDNELKVEDGKNVYQLKPWTKFYEDHVPESMEYPETTLPDMLFETARRLATKDAIIFKDRRISYREYDQEVDRLAAGLQNLGVKKGDRVAIHLPNCPQFLFAYFAILRIGAIVVPCNPTYTAREMTHQLNDSGSRLIITLSALYPLIKEIRSSTPLEQVIVAQIKSYLPRLTKVMFSLFKEKKGGHRVSIQGDQNSYWLKDVLKDAPTEQEKVEISGEDMAVLMYTGGTTGLSKGARLTHMNVLVNAWQGKTWINALDSGEIVIATLPLFHSYGMTTCLNAALTTGGTIILIPNPRDIDDIIKTIHKYRPTYYPGVPAFYVSVNNYADIGKYDLSSIRVCSSGAAPLPPEVQQQFQEITGTRVAEGFGLSEASPITHANPAFGDNRIGTVGIPWPDTEVKIVDADTGENIVGIGVEGELCIRGPQVMQGYWNMPTETANTLRSDPEGGGPWLYTGDIAVMDEDGYFRIVDRKKDMILGAGGLNIYPREIEDVLYEHPGVLEAAAAGVPVPGKGERVKAYVVLKPQAAVTEEDILAFCREKLAPYKVPKFVEFRESLPKTMVGKVLRRELVAEEKTRLKGGDSSN
jgi:long-chain acyl-CoA synthetase